MKVPFVVRFGESGDNALLVEFPIGAHSAGLVALQDDFLNEDRARR